MSEATLHTVLRWARCEPFSPLSNQQVMEYLAYKKYPIPKHRTTKQPTTNMESLQKMLLKVEDPVLEGVLEARHLKKAEAYLTDKYVGRDGRIHPLYTTLPQTGRLSSRRPNLQNLPQGRGSEVMKQAVDYIRGSFVADDGYLLAEMDWKAIEALLVGWFAGDESYMEASKKGVHDIFGSHLLFMDGVIPAPKTPWDADLPEWIEWFKEAHKPVRDRAKKRIHAGAYGQGPYNMARDLGIPVAEVKKLDKVFASMAPKVIAWQEGTRRRAHAEGRLTNPFGFTLPFFHVMEKRDGEWVLGREASECLAFLPQSTGAAMLREVLVDLGDHEEEGDTFQLLIPTHDSITFQVKEAEVSRVIKLVQASMERAWPELNGLSVSTETKVGRRMNEMKVWHG